MNDMTPLSMPDVMSDDELARALMDEERAAANFRDSTLADEQANALDFYEAQPFGDEVPGRSQIVKPVVQEVVDQMGISVLRTVVSGDRVVEFEARLPDQEDTAQEATEAVTDAFMRQQDGYKLLGDWLQSGLIEKIGIVKTAVVSERRNRRERLMVDQDQLAMLDMSGVLLDYADNGDGAFIARVQQQETRTRYLDFTIPSEEFLFSARARHEDDADYVAQRSRKTLSDLVEMGFDPEIVAGLPTEHGEDLSDARGWKRWGQDYQDTLDRPGAMREVELLEEYVRIDRDGDGIAERLKVFRVKEVILEVEEVDEQPFVVFCPFPRAHRMVGNSLADKVMDLQRTASVTLRQTLDGLFLSNRPRGQINDNGIGETTIDDWMQPGPGVLVRTANGGEIKPLGDAFDISRGLGMLEYLTGEQESRTGITRLNQGLDADALNKTATGTALMQAAGQQMEEFVARNFAEAMGRLFGKKRRLMRAEGQPILIRADGQVKEVDPSQWGEDMAVSVRVGLGSGRKDQRLIYWQTVIQDQNNLKLAGSALVSDENMFRTRDAAIRDMGLGLPTEYYTDPSTLPPQEPQPDPAMMEAQAKAEIEAAKLQGEQQRSQAQIELAREEGAAKIELMREEAAAKLDLEREKAASEAVMNQQRMAFEQAMAERQMAFNERMAERQADQKAEEMRIKANRPGGDLDK